MYFSLQLIIITLVNNCILISFVKTVFNNFVEKMFLHSFDGNFENVLKILKYILNKLTAVLYLCSNE